MTAAGGTPSDLLVRFSVLAAATERLDRFLADQLQLSRTQAARIVAEKGVRVAGSVVRASRTLKRGEEVEVRIPASEPPRHLVPAHIPLTIVYEDEHLLVIDKPAGLVVHPAPGHWDDTLVNALVARGTQLSEGGGEGRPGLVHRLDRDTSGLMVVAKNDIAHRKLAHAIAARRVKRVYAALSWGHLDREPDDHRAARRAPPAGPQADVRRRSRTAVAHRRLGGRPIRGLRAAATRAAERPHPPDPGPSRAPRAPSGR
jgi:23S rRNA pseudouridine1911/1915/1917 synthase